MKLTARIFSNTAHAATLIVALILVIIVIAGIAYVKRAVSAASESRSEVSTPSVLSQRPDRVETELITLHQTGFEPNEIRRPRGAFILGVDNRSGIESIELRLIRADGRRTPGRMGDDGSFTDFIGVGLTPPPTTPISQGFATDLLGRIARTPINQVTTQTLTFLAQGGYEIGTAVVNRSFTNTDANGNVKPTTNSSGRPVDNYSVRVALVSVTRPQK